eukprot:594853-Pleurochrysis_carterae.AAC.15
MEKCAWRVVWSERFEGLVRRLLGLSLCSRLASPLSVVALIAASGDSDVAARRGQGSKNSLVQPVSAQPASAQPPHSALRSGHSSAMESQSLADAAASAPTAVDRASDAPPAAADSSTDDGRADAVGSRVRGAPTAIGAAPRSNAQLLSAAARRADAMSQLLLGFGTADGADFARNWARTLKERQLHNWLVVRSLGLARHAIWIRIQQHTARGCTGA